MPRHPNHHPKRDQNDPPPWIVDAWKTTTHHLSDWYHTTTGWVHAHSGTAVIIGLILVLMVVAGKRLISMIFAVGIAAVLIVAAFALYNNPNLIN